MASGMVDYYRARAPEYEAVYFRPDPQRLYELEELGRALRGWLAGRDILEVAAGTGWWTVHAASVGCSVTATDAAAETLAIAQMKPLDGVRFEVADAFALQEVKGTFNGFLACYWLSHVSRTRLEEFFSGIQNRMDPGSRVFMADNVFVEGFGGQFIQETGNPDTYRIRIDSQGVEHKITKNYYSEEELSRLLSGMENVQIHMGPCYWWIMYETPSK